MSLIHNAIVEMEKKTSPTPVLPFRAAVPPAAPSGASRWLPVAGGFFLVIVLAAAAWWLWLSWRPAPVAAAVSPAVVQLPAPASPVVPVPVLVATAESTDLPAATPSGASRIDPAPASAAAAVAAPAGTATVVPAGPATARPRAATRPVSERAAPRPLKAEPAAAPEIPLERHYALFLDSLKSNNLPAASTHLQALQAQLPPDSLVRLRAEAWFAYRSGDIAQARLRYQAILDRVPGDEGASINLASIEARADKRELARSLLSDALRANPDSEAVREALNRFKAPAGN